MKSWNRIFVSLILLLTAVLIGMNVILSGLYHNKNDRTYRVEINRLQNSIKLYGIENIHLEQYNSVKNIVIYDENVDNVTFFEGNGSDYIIKYIDGKYYRFDYEVLFDKEYRTIGLFINLVMAVLITIVLSIMIYVRNKLMKPFHTIKEVPYELSKGNLSVGLKENKNRFFGRFIWGLDLLREHLEVQKSKELAMQKEKKTLVLSISHDIKTPLSAIKLYAKALLKNLYDSDEKRADVARNIGVMADEIEKFVSDIIKASSEDFLNLDVLEGEFYIKDLITKINTYYSEKLPLNKTEFNITFDSNCLIKGDLDRAVEVLQNIIENAIKYGDGGYINIRISCEEDCRLVTVVNSGSSLPGNEVPYIFDSFWRGSNVGSHSGNGLGLYICRQLMQKMDGDIYAESEENEMRITAVFRMI